MVTLADFEIIEIVGRGNLDGAGAVGGVGVFVGDDRDGAVGEGKLDEAADEVLITLVVRVDGDGDIAEEGLGAGGADDDFAVSEVGRAINHIFGDGDDFVGDVPEVARFVFVFDFDVGEGGLVLRAEVDELLATVDHAVVPHFFEGLVDAGDDVFVEGEGEVRPSAAGAEGADLEFHVAALFFDEVPDTRIEFVARKFEASMTFLLEGAFVDDPGFEAGVVGARDIPSGFTAEAIVAGQGIFDGDGEAVADVKVAVGIRRRHDDRIAILGVAFVSIDDWRLGLEGASSLPESINIWFELSRFITLRKTHIYIIAQMRKIDTMLGIAPRIAPNIVPFLRCFASERG